MYYHTKKKISSRNRPSFPIVYTTQGTFVAASFSGQCLTCRKKYYVSYSESENGVQQFYSLDETAKYFMHTSQTAFEVRLLKQLSAQLALALVTFESQAEVYNALHSSEDVMRLKVAIPHNSINIMQCCLSSPITGCRHQKPSKYCTRHQHLEADGDDSDDSSLVIRIPLPTSTAASFPGEE